MATMETLRPARNFYTKVDPASFSFEVVPDPPEPNYPGGQAATWHNHIIARLITVPMGAWLKVGGLSPKQATRLKKMGLTVVVRSGTIYVQRTKGF